MVIDANYSIIIIEFIIIAIISLIIIVNLI